MIPFIPRSSAHRREYCGLRLQQLDRHHSRTQRPHCTATTGSHRRDVLRMYRFDTGERRRWRYRSLSSSVPMPRGTLLHTPFGEASTWSRLHPLKDYTWRWMDKSTRTQFRSLRMHRETSVLGSLRITWCSDWASDDSWACFANGALLAQSWYDCVLPCE